MYSFLTAFEQVDAETGNLAACRLSFSSRAGVDWPALLAQIEDRAVGRGAGCNGQGRRPGPDHGGATDPESPSCAPPGPYTREILTMGGRSVDGIVFAASYTEDNPRPQFQDFLRRYRERFGWPPASPPPMPTRRCWPWLPV